MMKDIMENCIKIEDKCGFMFVYSITGILCYIDEINKHIQNNEIEFLVFILECCEHEATDQAGLQRLFGWLENLYVPSIAFIDGSCYGEYLEFAMMCDIRIGGKSLFLNFPSDISSFTCDFIKRCRILMGLEHELNEFENLLGSKLDLQHISELRLINHIIETDDVVEEIKKYLQKLQNNKTGNQIMAIMKCFNNYKHHGLDKNKEMLLEEESKQFCGLIMQEYIKSGMQNED